RSGKMWPGVTRSSGMVAGSTATLTVWARSRAEIPVVMPWRASMLTVKAVPRSERLSAVIMGRRRWATRSSVMARQMRPRPWRAMKLIASGVTMSAAMVRSPSFSRSSSSTTITMRPARICSTASGTDRCGLLSGMRLHQAGDVFGDEVCLDVDTISRLSLAQARRGQGVGDEHDREDMAVNLVHGEADAVDRHRALGGQEGRQLGGD